MAEKEPRPACLAGIPCRFRLTFSLFFRWSRVESSWNQWFCKLFIIYYLPFRLEAWENHTRLFIRDIAFTEAY